jgi:hypothetical protein
LSSQTISYTKLADRNVSFGLARTNPKLTSNIKLTVDSGGLLWLNSIDAVEQLADQKYKRFAVASNSNHEANIFKFYDNGSTPSKITFALGSSIRTDIMARDLKDQYDFDLYSSGAKYLSAQYSEKFSYFAPLYLDKVLPEYFVIFKIPGASNYTTKEWYEKVSDPTFNQAVFAEDLFKKAHIVKTFSLKENTKIGGYIRNILANPMYPKNPLYVNFKEGRYSLYRGASITSGTYVEIPELLDSTLRKAVPQLKLEQYITGGFERNNVIYPKILNLEFLFNDETSNDYEINRYFGFYCNAVDLATFDLDLSQMFVNSSDNDNPLPKVFDRGDEISLTVTNPNGVLLRGEGFETNLNFINSALSDRHTLFFPYLRSKNDNLHFLKIQPADSGLETFEQVANRATFSVDDTQFDIGTLFGPGTLLSQERAVEIDQTTRATVAISLEKVPENLDTIRVYHQNGSTWDPSDPAGRYDDLVFVSEYFENGEEYSLEYPQITPIYFDSSNPNEGSPTFTPNDPEELGVEYISSIDGRKWLYDGSEYVTGAIGSRIYINIENATIDSQLSTDLSKLANTVLTVLKSLDNSFLTGAAYENTIFLQNFAYGNSYGMIGVKDLEYLLSENYPKFKINGKETTSIIYADGGQFEKQVKIPSGNIDRLTPILDQIVVRTDRNWSRILRVCNSSLSINNDTAELTSTSLTDYLNNATLMLRDDEKVLVDYQKIEIRNIFRPKIGILSLFEIKDLDFDTYSSQYSKTPIIDLYQYYYAPSGVTILDFNKYVYQLVGTGSIQIGSTIYETSDTELVYVWQNSSGLAKYTVLSGDAILVQSNILPWSVGTLRRDIALLDEDENLQSFTGFFSLGADHSLPNPDSKTYNYREKFLSNNLSSEYHVYLENFSSDFALESRVIPYISKWGIIDSTDSRGNTYRLNSDILFGKDNFGPSHRETLPTAEKLTHEWFYIESDFNYSLDNELLKKNYYYFNSPLNVEKLISDPTYFETYFTYVPESAGTQLDRPQFRYSKLIKDEFTNQYATVFNGAKFVFSELGEDGKILPTTTRFNDYNFSTLLKPVKEDLLNPQSPVKFRIIENTDAKSILVLVELAIGYIDQISKSMLVENSQFPDSRIDQTTLFTDEYLIEDTIPNSYRVSMVYLTDTAAEFTGIVSGLSINLSSAGGTAYDPITGETLLITDLKSTDLLLVKNGAVAGSALSSNSVETGDKTFTVSDPSIFPLGVVARVNTITKTGYYMEGIVTYVDGNDVTITVTKKYGSGTYSNWNINPIQEAVVVFSDNSLFQDINNNIVINGCRNINSSYPTVKFHGDNDPNFADTFVPLSATELRQTQYVGDDDSQWIFYNGDVRYIPGTLEQYLKISNIKSANLGDRALRGRVLTDTDTTFFPRIQLNSADLQIVSYLPSYLGVFGDYRISFNENGVSNLTYNFLYSARDKKYNSTRSSFSTVKLAIGVDLSATSTSFSTNENSLATIATALSGLPSQAFRLESFINPISASHAAINSSPALKAFSPLMLIDKNGKATIAVKTSSSLSTNTADQTKTDLGNQYTTGHLIKSVNGNTLLLEYNLPGSDNNFSSYATSVYSGPSNTPINLSTNYVDADTPIQISALIQSAKVGFSIGDVVTVSNSIDPDKYVSGIVTGVSSSSLSYILAIDVRYQSVISPTSGALWVVNRNSQPKFVYPSILATLTGPTQMISSGNLPGGSKFNWINNNQQFQLFGGKSYFTNLFENISFASFAKALEQGSELISWESYSNGVAATSQLIEIQVEKADEIQKQSIVVPVAEQVETASRVETGGFIQTESYTQPYELFRYSGEYDVIYRSIAGFKYRNLLGDFDLVGSNVRLNPEIPNFFVLPEFWFVKYAQQTILELEESSKFNAKYPLINEVPIDYASFNALASSWDFGYHYAYTGKKTRTAIPGSNRLTEDYSFVSKLINVPFEFVIETFNVVGASNSDFEISDIQFATRSDIDILYSVYETDVKFKINLKKLIAKTLISNGIGTQFEAFFVDSNDNPIVKDPNLIGVQTLSQYTQTYCETNLAKLYQLDALDFYEKTNHTLADNSVSFAQAPYSQLASLGYSELKTVQINNPKSDVLTGSIAKLSSTGISLVPKLKIKYI